MSHQWQCLSSSTSTSTIPISLKFRLWLYCTIPFMPGTRRWRGKKWNSHLFLRRGEPWELHQGSGRRREDSQCLWHYNTGRLGDFPANGFHEKGQSPIAVMLPKRLFYYRTLSTTIVSSSSNDSFPLLLRSTWRNSHVGHCTTPTSPGQSSTGRWGGRPQILLRVEAGTMRNDKFQRAIMETMQESPEASGNPSNPVLYLLRGQRTDGLVIWIPNRWINPTISAHTVRRGTN